MVLLFFYLNVSSSAGGAGDATSGAGDATSDAAGAALASLRGAPLGDF